jgi:hypothetical protein
MAGIKLPIHGLAVLQIKHASMKNGCVSTRSLHPRSPFVHQSNGSKSQILINSRAPFLKNKSNLINLLFCGATFSTPKKNSSMNSAASMTEPKKDR